MEPVTENTELKQKLLEAVFNASNSRFIVFTAIRNYAHQIIDFEFSLLTKASAEYLGRDITGMRFTQIVPNYEPLLKDMIQVIETGITHNWVRHIEYMDQGPMWFSITDSKSGDNLVRYWEDITEQRKAQKTANDTIAKKTEEKYLSLFNSVEQGFCVIEMIFDSEGNAADYIFLDYNPAFEKQTGLKNAKGRSMKSLAPKHEQHWFDLYGEIVKTGKPKYFEQTSTELLNGGWYEVSAFPLTNEQDNRVGIIFNDVSERKRVEKEKEDFNRLLEDQVTERTARLDEINRLLEEKNAELAQSNKELESFTYVASHDLQEPLRKLQTFVGLLDERIGNPDAARNYMGKIYTSAQRMNDLIHDVLQYSRLSGDTTFSPVDLNEAVHNVISDFEVSISQKKATVTIDKLPVINGSALQMHQLFSNLLSNSLKYSSTVPVINISSKLFNENNMLKAEIIFSDNGIGFDSKYSDQIFNLFQRLHGKSEYSGTGIGLSICKKVIEQHNGTITAQSEPGKGTAFIITLPVIQAP